jgi:hypothetical protein
MPHHRTLMMFRLSISHGLAASEPIAQSKVAAML